MDQIKFGGTEKILSSCFPQHISPPYSSTPVGIFAETIDQPFNFISASRRYNPVASDLEEHLSNFLRHVGKPTELTEFAVPMIASSFLLDNYPPGAHSRWALSSPCR